jgi:hypothetical protein
VLDGNRVRSKLRSLDYDWLRDSESRSICPIPELGKKLSRLRDGNPSNRPELSSQGNRCAGQMDDMDDMDDMDEVGAQTQ